MTNQMILWRWNENPSNNLVTRRSLQDIDAWVVNQKLCVWTDKFPFQQNMTLTLIAYSLQTLWVGQWLPHLSLDFPSFSENSLDCVYPLHLFQIYLWVHHGEWGWRSQQVLGAQFRWERVLWRVQELPVGIKVTFRWKAQEPVPFEVEDQIEIKI